MNYAQKHIMIEFMEIKRYPLINQIFGNGFQQNKKKNRWTQNIQPAHNLQIKNRIDLYYVFNSYLKIWDSRYFCKHCIKEDKCKVLATENNTNKAKSKILILPAT